MRYVVSKGWFVLLLINSKDSKIDANCEKNEEVEKSIVIVKRDKREGEIDCFDREIIFAHDIDFFDVLSDVIDFFDVITDVVNGAVDAEKTADFIEIDENEELGVWDDDIDDTDDTDDIDDTDAKGVDENETGEVDEIVDA